MQRAEARGSAVHRVRDGQRIGIDLDDGVDHRTVFVDRIDTTEIRFGELAGCESTAAQSLLQLADRDLIQLERRRRRVRRRRMIRRHRLWRLREERAGCSHSGQAKETSAVENHSSLRSARYFCAFSR